MEILSAQSRIPGWRRCILLACIIGALPVDAQITETPETILPGKFSGKVQLLSLSLDRHDPTQADKPFRAEAVVKTMLATGLTQDLDLQVGLDSYWRENFYLRGKRASNSGIGAWNLRSKYTFWRDPQAGATAAVVPYIRIPTRRFGVGSGAAEGGVIVPWAMGRPGGTTWGAMGEWDLVRNDDDTGYDSVWYVAGLVRQPITKSFTIFAESTLAVSSAKASAWAGTIGGGASWLLTEHMRLDGSVHRAFVRRANSWNPVISSRWDF